MADKILSAIFLYPFKFVVFEFQSIANIHTKGQQSKRDLRNNTGIIVLHVGIIAPNIHNCTVHIFSLENPPPATRGRTLYKVSPYTFQPASADARSAP